MKIKIFTFSYLNGKYLFDNNQWVKIYNNDQYRLTKYPPQEGTCKILDNNNKVYYCGDVAVIKENEYFKKYFVEKYSGYID